MQKGLGKNTPRHRIEKAARRAGCRVDFRYKFDVGRIVILFERKTNKQIFVGSIEEAENFLGLSATAKPVRRDPMW